MKEENKKVPSIRVKQRIMLKRTEYTCHFFDGFSTVDYKNPKVAQETYKRMKEAKQKVKLEGNTLFEYRPKLKAQEIYDLYIKDIEKGVEQAKKSKGLIKIKYELIE